MMPMSVCLCEVKEPSKELVDKYGDLKATFIKRLVNLYEKAHETLGTLAEGTITGEKAKEIVEHVRTDHRAQTAGKLIAGLAEELEPLVEKARLATLGTYEEHLRPHVGEYLDHLISSIKPVLDTWMPAEDH
ncbi:hypothetical protein NFI96_034281 [Prochilodus magdalenae]|nr:hypothetical protein NFI96_034281 [Prochilodus magdalenae]